MNKLQKQIPNTRASNCKGTWIVTLNNTKSRSLRFFFRRIRIHLKRSWAEFRATVVAHVRPILCSTNLKFYLATTAYIFFVQLMTAWMAMVLRISRGKKIYFGFCNMRAYFEVIHLVGLITVAIPYGDWLRVKNWFATGYCKKHLTIIHYSIVVKRNETIEIMLITTANCLEASVSWQHQTKCLDCWLLWWLILNGKEFISRQLF